MEGLRKSGCFLALALKIRRSRESSSFDDILSFILLKITFPVPHLSWTGQMCAHRRPANAPVIGLLPSLSVSLLQELRGSAWRAFLKLFPHPRRRQNKISAKGIISLWCTCCWECLYVNSAPVAPHMYHTARSCPRVWECDILKT